MSSFPKTAQDRLAKAVDVAFALWPRRKPRGEILKNCKIVSHRGEHDNQTVLENTLPAFDRVLEAGVWGLELDFRWTRDLHPVVLHDATLARLHGRPVPLADLSLAQLKRDFPAIPTLEEVLARYGKKLHLMLEIKEEPYTNPTRQKDVLRHLLSPLEPMEDFHVLSLSPGMFGRVDFLPPEALVAVGTTHLKAMSRFALQAPVGGIAGHYLLMHGSRLRKHSALGQRVGTGYAASRNVLYRELNRGVDWIFSNNAIYIQSFCKSL